MCDGENDCEDGHDELSNCTCLPSHFQCGNGRCILNRFRCDGWNDCIDHSDETSTLCATLPCGPHAFRCRNRICIQQGAICDGNDDCGDGFDEMNCESQNKCKHDQFQCERDQFCISKQLWCNGETDCIDGSDELNCPVSVCQYGTCSQVCLEKKGGHHNCKCATGYEVNLERNDSCLVTGPEVVLFIASGVELRYLLPYKKDQGTTIHGSVSAKTRRINVFDLYLSPDGMHITAYWIDTFQKLVQRLDLTTLDLKESRFRRETVEDAAPIVSSHSRNSNDTKTIKHNLAFNLLLRRSPISRTPRVWLSIRLTNACISSMAVSIGSFLPISLATSPFALSIRVTIPSSLLSSPYPDRSSGRLWTTA